MIGSVLVHGYFCISIIHNSNSPRGFRAELGKVTFETNKAIHILKINILIFEQIKLYGVTFYCINGLHFYQN